MNTDQIRKAIAEAGGLVNAAAIARDFNVSAERGRQLMAEDDFPVSVAQVNGRPVWLRIDALQWRTDRSQVIGHYRSARSASTFVVVAQLPDLSPERWNHLNRQGIGVNWPATPQPTPVPPPLPTEPVAIPLRLRADDEQHARLLVLLALPELEDADILDVRRDDGAK